jgi:hypothetical protein
MVSSVWTGSAQTSVIWSSGNAAVSSVDLVWTNSPSLKGVTVSAQAALSGFVYAVEPDKNIPIGTATAVIKSFRAELGSPFIPVNAPTLSNVTAVEIIFELSVTAFEGAGTAVGGTMVGTVFIQ